MFFIRHSRSNDSKAGTLETMGSFVYAFVMSVVCNVPYYIKFSDTKQIAKVK